MFLIFNNFICLLPRSQSGKVKKGKFFTSKFYFWSVPLSIIDTLPNKELNFPLEQNTYYYEWFKHFVDFFTKIKIIWRYGEDIYIRKVVMASEDLNK